jgi:hypothetical protein
MWCARLGVVAVRGSPPGSAPAWRVTFFCWAQKKVTKEEGPKSHLTAHLRRKVLLMAIG